MLGELPSGYKLCQLCGRNAHRTSEPACSACVAQHKKQANTASNLPPEPAAVHGGVEFGPFLVGQPVRFPERDSLVLGWSFVFRHPFSSAASKNVMWQPLNDGRMIQRKSSSEFERAFVDRLRTALPPGGLPVVQHRLWLDLHVEMPSHRTDALNVLDLVADAVQDVIGLDDRWFCLAGLTWDITKTDPHLTVRMGQEAEAVDSQPCGRCGDLLELSTDNFSKNRSKDSGFSNRCKRCDKAVRLRRQGLPTAAV